MILHDCVGQLHDTVTYRRLGGGGGPPTVHGCKSSSYVPLCTTGIPGDTFLNNLKSKLILGMEQAMVVMG